MKFNYFAALAGILLIGLTAYMIYANKENWGWVLFVAIIFIGSTVITKKDIEGLSDSEEDEG
jgi:hypothetical protein